MEETTTKTGKLDWIKNVKGETILQTIIAAAVLTIVGTFFSSVLMSRINANEMEHIQKTQEIQTEQINMLKEGKVSKEMLIGIKSTIETQNSIEHKAIVEKIDAMSKSQDEYNKVIMELIKRR